MSYLDVPRIHVMGLFYSAPGNLNNLITNYDLSQALDFDTGLYKYPDGTAQLFLVNCAVTSVAGPDGVLCSDRTCDALVGARVTSPGPDTQKPDGKGGLFGFAKLVDLDPSMQFRSAVYGFRIYVDIEGGGGFSGELGVPQLRDLWFARGNAGITGLQVAVGTWHQRLTNLTWSDPSGRSPVYDALRARSSAGLDVKMGVDMFQTRRANEFTQGSRFGYGRLAAVIGPAADNEPKQLVPGRRLYTPATFGSPPLAAAEQGLAKIEFSRQAAEEAMSAEAMSAEAATVNWNRTDFRVCDLSGGRSLLIVDLFNSAPLASGKKGELNTGGKVVVGFLDGTPLAKGEIAFRYASPDSATRKLLDVVFPEHAGVFQIELTPDERLKIANTPVAIRVEGTTAVRENTNGVYLNIEQPSTRLEPNGSETLDVYSYRFGQPTASLPSGLTLQTKLFDDSQGTMEDTTIFSAALDSRPVESGHFRLTIKTGPKVPLTPVRKPLDSFLCFLVAQGSDYLVGEALRLPPGPPPTPPLLSLLFWQNHLVVDKPTWEQNIQPIMKMYARLFPGMVSILDISDLATVKGFAGALIDRFERARTDPGFMPVSRDMSPATVSMMLRFLDGLTKEQ